MSYNTNNRIHIRDGVIVMLIKYEFGNFRSFKQSTTLSMMASSQRTLNESLIRTKGLRILPSAVMYGANASGKSNIIKSMEVLQNIIARGNLSSALLRLLSLCPFMHDNEKKPMHFGIDFINNDLRFEYILDIYVDRFKPQGRIFYEKLSFVESKKESVDLYERKANKLSISNSEKALELMRVDKDILNDIEKKLNDNLDDKVLFLTGGFKNIISSQIADTVIEFFTQKFITISDFSNGNVVLEFKGLPQKQNIKVWNELLDVFVKAADFGPQQLSYVLRKNDDAQDSSAELVSEYTVSGRKVTLPAHFMESDGTMKLIDFALIFQNIFTSGGTMIIDEFDSSLHPEIVKGLIALFNDNTVNTNGAQLIFTTHNPIYLNNRIFRRDQILFVDKDKSSYQSSLYTLADFGSEEVRNDENYLLNYFKGKYCSMPFIDFSLLLKNASEKTVQDERR